MQKDTKENEKIIEEKLKTIGLDLGKIPKSLLSMEKIKYKPLKSYEDNNYKIYKYVNVKDIEILITPVDRLDDLNEKIKKALPLAVYLNSESEETIEYYTTFLKLLNNLDVEKLEQIEEEQKELNKCIPYEIKYKNNYIWQIYYSEIEDKYFMLFSSNDNNPEALFYLIKKKLQAQKTRKKEKIYVPISHLEYSSKILKKSEIADMENYLWFFTKDWPNIYEVYDQNDEPTIQILGETSVYDKVNSMYKISLTNTKEAAEKFKLIKALFILQSTDEEEYNFKTIINENGSIDFCYNLKKLNYENLSEFIRQEVEVKQEKIDAIYEQNIVLAENLELLKETVKKQKEEYLIKEKQITNFLECKKTFFGRVKYFFKKPNKVKQVNAGSEEQSKQESNIELGKVEKIEKKALYTIEDLLKICETLEQEETKLKNTQMDIKALENKKENLERKIQNATLYINEIESHKKSIFDFWKFTNKDEVSLLTEAEKQESENDHKLKKQFDYEEDLEDFGKQVDSKQRTAFTKNECDAVFAIKQDIDTFNILNKPKVLKKDDTQIQKKIKELKQEYMENIDTIEEKDFDIFGNVAQDKTKIKVLNNNKHREIEKDKYKILDIKSETTLEEYKQNLENYKILLKEAYGKMLSPYDIAIYKVSETELEKNSFEIMNLNPKKEILKKNNDIEKINLYKINVKEKMPIIFYSNIMFYDNLNKTLPLGMDIETDALIDLSKFDMKLVSRKDFYINKLKNEFENSVQLVQTYEYNLEIKQN